MQTFPAYQARLVINGLTNLSDELELAEIAEWHTIARAAACLEQLLYGEQPTDMADVAASLVALKIPNPGYRQFGKFTFLLVEMAATLLEAMRLGLLDIQPKLQRPALKPVFIGIDMATGPDRSVFHPRGHHA